MQPTSIELKPEDASIYANRGNAYTRQGNLELAIQDYNTALELDPSHGGAYVGLGNAFDKKGDLERAIQYYSKAIELESDHPVAYYNRGSAYNKKGEADKAIADYTKVIELRPLIELAHYFLGEVYMQVENWSEAKLNLMLARTLGVEITGLFDKKYGSVANFEQVTGIQLPPDIVSVLTP